MTEGDWLNEMMDAALEDPHIARREPDFPAIFRDSVAHRRFASRRTVPYRILLAAAALLLALPGGVFLARHMNTRRMVRNESSLFVQELLGGTIFEEGLGPGESRPAGGFLEGGMFDPTDEVPYSENI